MLNKLRPVLARVLEPAGQALARTPLTPNAVTVIGTVGVSAGALVLFPAGHLFAGTIVCTVFVLADMLDGALARVKGTSGPFGAFLDSTLDRVADAAIFAGLAAYFVLPGPGRPDRLLAAVSLFCLISGALVSYAKARAQGLGLNADVGIAERPERMVVGLAAIGLAGLGVPYVLPVGLWLLAAASAVTFVQRVAAVHAGASASTGSASTASASTGSASTGSAATGAGSTGRNADGGS